METFSPNSEESEISERGEKLEGNDLQEERASEVNLELDKEIVESIEDSSLDIQEKVELILVMAKLKPATEIVAYSEEWQRGESEKEIDPQDVEGTEGLIKETGLMYEIMPPEVVDSGAEGVKEGEEFGKRMELKFLVAGTGEGLDLIKKAYATNDEELFGKAYGFPQSSIEAYSGKRELISQNELLDKGVDEEAVVFARFELSRDNWEEEIKKAEAWARAVKEISPKVYRDFVEVMSDAIRRRGLHSER